MKKIFLGLVGLGTALVVYAEIYKHVDNEGRVTYSNVPSKGAVKLQIESPPPPTGGIDEKAAEGAPSSVDIYQAEQIKKKQLVAQRREVLEEELAKERQSLEETKAFYGEAKKDPEVFLRIVDDNGKIILGAKEAIPVIATNGENAGKYIVVDGHGDPYKSDGKEVLANVDAKGKPIPYLMVGGEPRFDKNGKPAIVKKKRGRNMAWYAEKLKQLELEIKTHEDNIQVLEEELSRL